MKAIKNKENTWDSLLEQQSSSSQASFIPRDTQRLQRLLPCFRHMPSLPSPSASLSPHTPTPLTPSTPPAVLSELAHTADTESSLLSQPQTLARKINSNLASSQPHVTRDKPVLYAIHQIKPGRQSLWTERSSNPLPGQSWHSLIYLLPHGPALARGAPARPHL